MIAAVAIYNFGIFAALVEFFEIVATAAKVILGVVMAGIVGCFSALVGYLANAIDLLICKFRQK